MTPVWERQRARGQRRHTTGWTEVTHKWFFSTSMSPVDKWVNINIGRMQQHLQVCMFNERNTTIRRPPETREHHKLHEELKKRVELKKTSGYLMN